MSITFFWDKKRKKFLCERRRIGLEGGDFNKDLTYVFNNISDFASLMLANKKRIIYDEHGTYWTVDSLRKEIERRGCVVVVEGYWPWL